MIKGKLLSKPFLLYIFAVESVAELAVTHGVTKDFIYLFILLDGAYK